MMATLNVFDNFFANEGRFFFNAFYDLLAHNFGLKNESLLKQTLILFLKFYNSLRTKIVLKIP
jgi:hypothetical protein